MSERYSILCVDDDLSSLEASAALLEEESCSVTAVSCPLKGLELDATKLHLAVLDFAMPALNGFGPLLGLYVAHAYLPTVLLSGMIRGVAYNMRRVFSICLDKGKPVDPLLSTIRSFLTLSPDPPDCRLTDNNDQPRTGGMDSSNLSRETRVL